ncbi:MAG: outer membrane lipoprotein-sorting protein [Deltaproteobacteria bacterium]|nr:outer membrane lipoprotein-sorting protein [Deltaproteobacteria bacterium]
MDETEYGAKDSLAVVTMELEDSGGTKSTRKMKMYQMGTGYRMIKFLAPADVKGMAFLDAEEKMYVYMPAMHKIRRIAGSVKNDSFAGTDFSYDDLSSDRFSDRLQPSKMTEDAEHYVLELVPKPDIDSEYGKTKMWVRKKDFLFDRLEFYDKRGAKWKVLDRRDFRQVGKYVQSFHLDMHDLKRNHWTRNIVESIECDKGLEKRFFSKRQLKRQ